MGNSMTSYMVSKKTMEVNPKHSIMTELRKKAAADKSDKTVKDLIWLLFDTSLLTSALTMTMRVLAMMMICPRLRRLRGLQMRPRRWRKLIELRRQIIIQGFEATPLGAGSLA